MNSIRKGFINKDLGYVKAVDVKQQEMLTAAHSSTVQLGTGPFLYFIFILGPKCKTVAGGVTLHPSLSASHAFFTQQCSVSQGLQQATGRLLPPDRHKYTATNRKSYNDTRPAVCMFSRKGLET